MSELLPRPLTFATFPENGEGGQVILSDAEYNADDIEFPRF